LVSKPEGKRPIGRPRHRWEDNIRMDLREAGWEDVDWIHPSQDTVQWRALVNCLASQEGFCSVEFVLKLMQQY
jgi:hypothetical protein